MYDHLLLKFILPAVCRAQAFTSDLEQAQIGVEQKFQEKSGFNSTLELGGIVYKVITGFLSLLSIIFIILVIYAGYSWMSAQGDEAKVTKAKDTIYRAIIGLILILAAYSITYFVFKYVPFGGGGGPQGWD